MYAIRSYYAKVLIPFMLVFALYVQFHGDFGPGGGFQAGVIGAAAIIFYALIFGLPAARRLVPDALVETMVGLGVLRITSYNVCYTKLLRRKPYTGSILSSPALQ